MRLWLLPGLGEVRPVRNDAATERPLVVGVERLGGGLRRHAEHVVDLVAVRDAGPDRPWVTGSTMIELVDVDRMIAVRLL